MSVYNPLQSRRFSGDGILNPMDGINDPNLVHKEFANTFKLHKLRFQSEQFGKITPFFMFDALPRDRVRLQLSSELRAPSFKCPVATPLRKSVDCFAVPYESIFPHTWKYIFTNPIKGDDIDDSVTSEFDVFSFIDSITLPDPYGSTFDCFTRFVKRICLTYLVFSKQGLFNYLGYKFGPDFDNLISSLPEFIIDVVRNESYLSSVVQPMLVSSEYFADLVNDSVSQTKSYPPEYDILYGNLTDDQVLDLLINQGYYLIDSNDSGSSIDFSEDVSTFHSILNPLVSFSGSFKNPSLAPLVAYQQIMAQFYSSESVDSVFTSEMYMDAMQTLSYFVNNLSPDNPTLFPLPSTFTYNGFVVTRDFISKAVLDSLIERLQYTQLSGNYSSYLYDLYTDTFIQNLFGLGDNLRYGDFFMSARVQPLAVGDVTISADNGIVQALDVTQNLAMQRFLNAVNRCGSRLVNYLKSIFNSQSAIQNAEPHFICSERFNVQTDKVTNVADNQGQITENPITMQSNYLYDIYISDPCLILGLVSYDIIGSYNNVCDPTFFKISRFDMFNPFLQNIGDQSIDREYLWNGHRGVPSDFKFGYTVRDAEYKSLISDKAGFFDGSSNADVNTQLILQAYTNPTPSSSLNSYNIRYRVHEIDPFFVSLPHFDEFYHFSLSYNIQIDAVRSMQFAPSIL